jgi:hypothetical protein
MNDIFIPILASLLVFIIGAITGENYERTRLYDKCLTEKESDSHKVAVEFCKERMK